VVTRRVADIMGELTGRQLVLAESWLVPRRLPPDFLDRLVDAAGGIGGVLAGYPVQVRRQLLWWGGWSPGPGREPIPSRTYRIFVGEAVGLLVTEKFLVTP
jgi:chorismate-pyruvate lyase